MKTVKTLEQIASITTLLTYRDKVPEFSDEGTAYGLGIKDLVGAWPQPVEFLRRILLPSDQKIPGLEDGDILMPGRGSIYPARYYSGSSERVYPLGQIHIIRPHDKVLGRYLTWYLNRGECQRAVQLATTGTTVMALKKSTLNALEIPLPMLSTIERINRLNELRDEQSLLQLRLTNIRRLELDTACERLLEQGLSS